MPGSSSLRSRVEQDGAENRPAPIMRKKAEKFLCIYTEEADAAGRIIA